MSQYHVGSHLVDQIHAIQHYAQLDVSNDVTHRSCEKADDVTFRYVRSFWMHTFLIAGYNSTPRRRRSMTCKFPVSLAAR